MGSSSKKAPAPTEDSSLIEPSKGGASKASSAPQVYELARDELSLATTS